MSVSKPAYALNSKDLESHPVWRYKSEKTLLAHEDEGWVEPADFEPIEDAYGHFFAAEVLLPDKSKVVALVGNTEPFEPKLNEMVQFFVFFKDDKQLRWHPEEHAAEDLAEFLGKSVEATTPFFFDITRYLAGDRRSLAREVTAKRSRG